MKIIFTVAGLQPEYGGPSRSVPALTTALAQTGVAVELLTCESVAGQSPPLLPTPKHVASQLLPNSCRTHQWWPRTNGFAIALKEKCANKHDCVIHDNGLWLPTNHAVAFAARKLNLPRIVSPRGMLTVWALQHRGFKKRLAWWLYQQGDLQIAQVLHATSADEAADFRATGLTQPIAIIPNGVELPPEVQGAEVRSQKSEVSPPTSDLRTALFLSRINPKKGLLDLVRAWARIEKAENGNRKSEIGNRKSPEWRVVIAGGDEEGHLEVVKAEIRKLKLESSFVFVGQVAGDAKWDLYRSADLFVLPTKSENFGLVIAEALACGVPVVTTKGAPWEELVTLRCGWWTEIGVEPFAEALREATSLGDDELRAMGQRGRKLVEEKYTWSAAAEKMVTVYRWMLGQGDKPDCVQTTG